MTSSRLWTGMRCSLVMVTYNRWDLTRPCLESLWPTIPTEGFELLVVDNASGDETALELGHLSSRLRFLPQTENLGYSAANNLGAREAKGDYLLFVNNDLIFRPGWWQPMIAALEEQPRAGMVGNVQWKPSTMRFDHMGVIFAGLQPIHFGERFRFRPFRGLTRWGAVTAACCAVRRELFASVGGFDTVFRTGYEDIDLCLRLGRGGYHHVVANDSVVEHWVSSAPGRHKHTEENAQIFFKRWGAEIGETWARWDECLLGWNEMIEFGMRARKFRRREVTRALRRVFFANPNARGLLELKQF